MITALIVLGILYAVGYVLSVAYWVLMVFLVGSIFVCHKPSFVEMVQVFGLVAVVLLAWPVWLTVHFYRKLVT